MDYGIIDYYPRTQNFSILIHKYQVVYDSKKRNKRSPEDNVRYESYFFTGEEYLKLKAFLEEMSDQIVEITPENVAYFFVQYCKQNNIQVNEAKKTTMLNGCSNH